jgi:hypothetical protein
MVLRPPATLEPAIERRLVEGARFTEEFHMGESRVHKAMEALAARLDELDIPYAILGALALNAYGYLRATVDVDVLLTREGLERFRSASLGRGYVEKFSGSRGVRDTERNVDIDVVLAGDFPGDGREKPVAFPDPAKSAVRGAAFRLVSLETLIELKIASGMTAPHRLKDLADVIELIRVNALPPAYQERLHPYVRERFVDLWQAAQVSDSE